MEVELNKEDDDVTMKSSKKDNENQQESKCESPKQSNDKDKNDENTNNNNSNKNEEKDEKISEKNNNKNKSKSKSPTVSNSNNKNDENSNESNGKEEIEPERDGETEEEEEEIEKDKNNQKKKDKKKRKVKYKILHSKNNKSKKPKKIGPTYKRIQREMNEILLQPTIGVSGGPKSIDNLYEWCGTVDGPRGSPYENGKFFFDIHFSIDYPFKPPRVTCKTKIYHCNFNHRGEICLDILKDKWSPALTITKVLLSIIALLDDPNPEDPLDSQIAKHYLHDKEDHDKEARRWTMQYAKPIDN